MHSNSDLDNNLIKSLNSVHLPPPPNQRANSQAKTQMNQQAQFQGLFPGAMPEQASPNDLHLNNPQKFLSKDPQRRTSGSLNDFSLPLNTPPHSVMRQYSNEPPKKKKIQETPLNQTRSKKINQKLLSPQYSSPTSKLDNSSPIGVSKPPQPSFITTKQQKKAQRALLKQQQQLDAQKLLDQQIKQMESTTKEEEPKEVPSPRSMPKIVHNSDSKPPFSYATLIGMAILRGNDRKLTLSQIYHWISSTFKYYRKNDVGWQNSIRHNLSLNKAFIKTEKSSDGKGHYWEVQKGYEMQFLKGKSGKRSSLPPATSSTASSKYDISSDPIENDVSKTPKSQIRSSDDEYRPQLKKTNTVIGLQHFHKEFANGSDTEEDYEDDEEEDEEEEEEIEDDDDDDYALPRKRRQLHSVHSVVTGSLSNIPTLNAPDTNWLASATGEHIVFGQAKPSNTLKRPMNSPIRATRVSSLSSFSCNTNFETSPLKRQETGPLLEPLTPSSRITSFNASQQHQPQHQSQQTLHLGPQLPSLIKTPLRNSTNTSSGLNTQQNSYVLNFLRTPNTKIKTPNSNSIFKKFWNSPSFIDDFYTSPSIPRYSDDDHYKGLFGSPDKSLNNNSASLPNLSNILKSDSSKKFENSGSHGFSDLFGVDIVSVVKRAVENEKSSINEKMKDINNKSKLKESEDDHKTGNSTEDDEPGSTD